MLNDLCIQSRAQKSFYYLGIDSPAECFDPTWFKNYPYRIDYQFNARGFRDHEWPDSDLSSCIWCIGDSFTVGIGQPFEHTWPQVLSRRTGKRCINVSMDGASNAWIARRAQDIQHAFAPDNIVVMWSYLHRREHQDVNLDDEQRRLHYIRATLDDDRVEFQRCQQALESLPCRTVQAIVPNFGPQEVAPYDLHSHWNNIRGPDWPDQPPTSMLALQTLPIKIRHELTAVHHCWHLFENYLTGDHESRPAVVDISINLQRVIQVSQQDRARDGFHFDIVTAQNLVDQIDSCLR